MVILPMRLDEGEMMGGGGSNYIIN